jgi:carboxypeptidase Q
MHTICKRMLAAALGVTLVVSTLAAEERVDLDAIHKIRDEAFQNSKVMDHVFYLTDVNGPRLTNSPGFFSAADWVVKTLGEWGIKAHQEKWGPFGRGWTFSRFAANMTQPVYAPLIGVPLAYTRGTEGLVSGEVTIATLNADADLEKYKGKLRGKIVLMGPGRDLTLSLQPLGVRRGDADLAALANAPDPAPQFGVRPPGAAAAAGQTRPGARNAQGNGQAGQQFQRKLNQFLSDEGVERYSRRAGGPVTPRIRYRRQWWP